MIKKICSMMLAITCLFTITVSAEDWTPVYSVTNMTTAETAIRELTILSLNSSAMLINGATRYIDDDNTSLTPTLKEATTYLPIKAAAEIFNAYLDTNFENGTVDFRVDEANLGSNALDYNLASGIPANTYLAYIDGEAYMPIRKLAESIGKTVTYDNGYIVIGDSAKATALLEDTESYQAAKNIIDAFNPVEYTPEAYYVSATTGSDEGNTSGSLEKPFKTIQKASSLATAGSIIYIMGGTYRETLKPVNNGTAKKPIIYKAYNNEKVVISATEEVGELTTLGDGLYTASIVSLGDGRNQIFDSNGNAIPEARYPNINENDYDAADISPLFPTKGEIKVDVSSDKATPTYTATRFGNATTVGEADDYWKGGTFVTLHGGGWNIASIKISSSTATTLTFDENTKPLKWWFTRTNASDTAYGYITGHRNAIDLDNEWVVENNALVIKGNQSGLEYKKRQLAVDLTDKKYIQLDGIDTFAGGINMKNSEMCVIKNSEMKYISHYTLSYDQREGFIDSTGNNPNTDLNGAPFRGEVGVYVGGKNDVIRDCVIDTSAGAGLYMTGAYTKVYNNNIINCGYMGSSPSGIYISSDGTGKYNDLRGGYVIMHNTVRNTGRSCLIVHTTESTNQENWVQQRHQAVYLPCEISYNSFENGGLTTLDTGIVYIWGATLGYADKRTRIHHNIVMNDSHTPTQRVHSMLYHDNYVNMVDTYDNVMYFKNSERCLTNPVYIQRTNSFPTSYAEADINKNGIADTQTSSNYNNGSNIYVGNNVNELTASNYHDLKVFKAGRK